MTTQQNIPIEKVTKPIQLLAAWLAGLILVNTAFLLTAVKLSNTSWLQALLVIASIINVPTFLAAIFLLQTRFRPEMQEDSFYSKYLETKTGSILQPITTTQLSKVREEIYSASAETISIISDLQKEIEDIRESTGHSRKDTKEQSIQGKISEVTNSFEWNQFRIRLNSNLKNANIFKKTLASNGIPIHGTFGAAGGNFSDPPYVVIGPGFSVGQLQKLLNAIADIETSYIAYAHPEDRGNGDIFDYEGEVLIGAYNDHEYGLTLNDAIELINNPGTNIESFYSAIKH